MKHVIPRSLLMSANLKSIIHRGLKCDRVPKTCCHFRGLKLFSVVCSPKLRRLPNIHFQKDLPYLYVVRFPQYVDIYDEILQSLNDCQPELLFGEKQRRAQENGSDASGVKSDDNSEQCDGILQLSNEARLLGRTLRKSYCRFQICSSC